VSRNDHEVLTCAYACPGLHQRSADVHGRPASNASVVTQLAAGIPFGDAHAGGENQVWLPADVE
jgi:hypothetical protein